MQNGNDSSKWINVYFPLIAVQFLFAALPSFSKIAFRTFDPKFILIVRIGGGAMIFSILYRLFFYSGKIEKKHYLNFIMLAFTGVCMNQFLFLEGVARTTSINAIIIVATIPIDTLILSALLKQERITPLKIAAIALAFMGVFIIVGIENLNLGGYFAGNILLVLSAVVYSFYLVFSRKMLAIYKPFTVIAYVFIFGFFETIPMTLLPIFDIFHNPIPAVLWWSPAVILVFGTALPYLFNIIALRTAKSSLVASFIYLQPLFGIALSVIMLKERLEIKNVAAAVLILAGLTILSKEQKIAGAARKLNGLAFLKNSGRSKSI
jgi:drug/metabolite transporter (DMT)-like permease